jgi:hypothetical protein
MIDDEPTAKGCMPAFITIVLLAMYALLMFAPAIWKGATFDPTLQESLKTFLTIGIGYYIGTSQSSAKKDETIASISKGPQ